MALAAASPSHARELTPPEIYRRVVPSTLALRVRTTSGERFVGAAFLAFQSDRALTAWHLIRDAAEIKGIFSDGTPAEIYEVLARDELHDVALLRIAPSERTPLPVSLESPPIASRLYAFGSPRGYAFSISDGLLSQIQVIDGFPQYQLTCPFSPGNSGGPVVNEAGEVVGLSAWSKIGAQNLNFAIPARYLAALALGANAIPPAEARDLPTSGGDTVSPVVHELPNQPVPSASLSDFEAFQQFLASQTGLALQVTVRSAGGQRNFTFRMPARDRPAPESPALPPGVTVVAGLPASPLTAEPPGE
jgi:hypothetical protein